jgi:AcrR family transcriptional regulator
MDSLKEHAESVRLPAPRTPQSGVRTREIILKTAERLFAADGFDGTSMRQIGMEAGVPLALVSYHFKSKLGLYRAVFLAHAEAITSARVAQLERFQPSGDPRQTVRDLVLILVQPMIEMATAPGGRDFARLIAREVNEPLEAERGVLAEFIDPVAKLIIAQLEQAFPEVAKATVHWAFLFASGALAINHAATGRIERLSDGLCHSEDPSEIVDHLVDFATGGILSTFAADIAGKRRGKVSRTRSLKK